MLFKSERMYVRYFTTEDVDSMYEYRSHPECQRYQDWKATDRDEIGQFLLSIQGKKLEQDNETQLAICLKETDHHIGDLYFVRNDITITIGYTLHPHFHRQGLGKEIVESYVLYLQSLFPKHEIVAMVHPGNLASLKLLDALLFRNEGYEPKVDSIIYSKPASFPAISCLERKEPWLNLLRNLSQELQAWFGIKPVVYGSVGVLLQVAASFEVHDVDVLIPLELLHKKRKEFMGHLRQAGYLVSELPYLNITKDNFTLEFSAWEEWRSRCALVEAPENVPHELFQVLGVHDLVRLYQYLVEADFRSLIKKESDQQKLQWLAHTVKGKKG